MPRKKSEITTTENNQLSVFDYSGYSEEFKLKSYERKARIKANEQVATKAFYDIAQDVKAQHDEMNNYQDWLKWCDTELGYKKNMACSFLKIGTEIGAELRTKNLPTSHSALDTLARALSNANEETKGEILTAVEEEAENQKTPLTQKQIDDIIKNATDKAYKSLGNLKNYLRGLDSLDNLSPNKLATEYKLKLDIVNTAIQEIKTEKENQKLKQLEQDLESQKQQLAKEKLDKELELQKLQAQLQTYKDKEKSFEQAQIDFNNEKQNYDKDLKEKAEKLVKTQTDKLKEKQNELEKKIDEQKALNAQLDAQKKQLKNTTDWLKRIESFNASLNTKVVNIVSTVKEIQDPPNFEKLGQEQREVIFPYFSSVMNEFEKNSEAWGKAINNVYFALKRADEQVVNLINSPIDVEVSE